MLLSCAWIGVLVCGGCIYPNDTALNAARFVASRVRKWFDTNCDLGSPMLPLVDPGEFTAIVGVRMHCGHKT
jgi:hypothetical protein